MTRVFVYLPIFNNMAEKCKLTDNMLKDIEQHICTDPKRAPSISRTGGIRKLRWRSGSSGKSGGLRILYIDFEEFETIYMLFIYKKGDQENITGSQKIKLRKLADEIKQALKLEKEGKES